MQGAEYSVIHSNSSVQIILDGNEIARIQMPPFMYECTAIVADQLTGNINSLKYNNSDLSIQTNIGALRIPVTGNTSCNELANGLVSEVPMNEQDQAIIDNLRSQQNDQFVSIDDYSQVQSDLIACQQREMALNGNSVTGTRNHPYDAFRRLDVAGQMPDNRFPESQTTE